MVVAFWTSDSFGDVKSGLARKLLFAERLMHGNFSIYNNMGGTLPSTAGFPDSSKIASLFFIFCFYLKDGFETPASGFDFFFCLTHAIQYNVINC